MTDSRYSYDEKSEVWPYFGATLTTLVIVPWTISKVNRLRTVKKELQEQKSYDSGFRAPNDDEIQNFKTKTKREPLLTWNNCFFLISWLAFGFFAYMIINHELLEDKTIFDPYEILGIAYSATEKEIKSHYRKLSVKFHPDKVRDTLNMTREEIESRFVEITKAYKALTDDEIRENFIKYGHPDGPQQTFHGIALPQFLIEGNGSPIVIACYTIFIGLVLPYVVGSWWSGSKVYTKKGIHAESATKFFEIVAKERADEISHDTILNMLADSEEYKILLPNLSKDEIKSILISHLERKPVKNENEKYIVISRTTTLLEGYLDIVSAFRSTDVSQKILDVQKAIVQAIPLSQLFAGEVLQIPFMNIDKVKSSKVSNFKELERLNQKDLHSCLRLATQHDAEKVIKTAQHIPKIDIVDAHFKIPGEDIITPKATAHVVMKLKVHSAMNSKSPTPDLAKFEEEETDAILRNPFATNEIGPTLPFAHAPYFPGFHKTKWYIYLVGERDNKIIEGPHELIRLDLSNLDLTKEELVDGSKVNICTYKIPMTQLTPEKVGKYSFKILLVSNSYFGADSIHQLFMDVVEEPEEDEEANAEAYDMSEPEEDSIAGQMSQIRGDKTKKATVSDNDLSSDEEEDLSDIDTDTDAENESDDDEEVEEKKDVNEKKTK